MKAWWERAWLRIIYRLAAWLSVAALISSCTLAERQDVVKVAEGVCDVVLTAEDPTLVPLCATAAQVEAAIEALAASRGMTVSPHAPVAKDALYHECARQGAVPVYLK